MLNRRQTGSLRPIVIVGGTGRIMLEEYFFESGGNYETGYEKSWYRALTDPVTPGDDITLIGTRDWELGVNIEINRIFDDYTWRSPLIDGVQTDGGSQMDSSAILTVSALDKNEATLGTVGTISVVRAATTNTDVQDPVWLDPTYSIDMSTTITTSVGNLQATAYAFLFHTVWSAEVTTTFPGVLPIPPNADFNQLFPMFRTANGVTK
jgi:hypothetical protein